MTVLLFIIGLVTLIGGAELFLKSVDKFGVAWSVSPVVMGLTIVAFATGAPELAISLQAAAEGRADLVLGNILGSNIANILLILGIAGLVKPLKITRRIIRVDVPMVIAASILLFVLAMDGALTPMDGAIILAALIAYSVFMYTQIRKDRETNQKNNNGKGEETELNEPVNGMFYSKYIALLVTGLVLIVMGSRWMVHAAVDIAELLGISELIIGLTIVSIGTSLPEVATSLSAVRKGDSDTAVANVMGSNLYNILLTLGLTIVVAPGVLDVSPEAVYLDLPIMLIVAGACLPLFIPGSQLDRMEAAGFLLYYATYITYLIFLALDNPYMDLLETIILWVLIPITVLYIVVRLILYFRNRKADH